jgi:hypothetical protein
MDRTVWLCALLMRSSDRDYRCHVLNALQMKFCSIFRPGTPTLDLLLGTDYVPDRVLHPGSARFLDNTLVIPSLTTLSMRLPIVAEGI